MLVVPFPDPRPFPEPLPFAAYIAPPESGLTRRHSTTSAEQGQDNEKICGASRPFKPGSRLERRLDRLHDSYLGLRERPLDERSSGLVMTASAKLSRYAGDVHVAVRAERYLSPPVP